MFASDMKLFLSLEQNKRHKGKPRDWQGRAVFRAFQIRFSEAVCPFCKPDTCGSLLGVKPPQIPSPSAGTPRCGSSSFPLIRLEPGCSQGPAGALGRITAPQGCLSRWRLRWEGCLSRWRVRCKVCLSRQRAAIRSRSVRGSSGASRSA